MVLSNEGEVALQALGCIPLYRSYYEEIDPDGRMSEFLPLSPREPFLPPGACLPPTISWHGRLYA